MSEELGASTSQEEQLGQVQPDASQAEDSTSQKSDTSWVPKRIGEITAARRAAEARALAAEQEAARLSQLLAQASSNVSSSEARSDAGQSVEALAKAYAERMIREQRETESMSSRIAEINAAGAKEFGDEFESSVKNLQMAGVGGQDFLRVITNVPKAEAVVTWLGKSENLEEAMRIASLDPVQMGIEMTKLSSKAAKSFSKQVSKAPPPISTVDASAPVRSEVEPDASDVAAWMKWRQNTKKVR